jgi:hypothetical protein
MLTGKDDSTKSNKPPHPLDGCDEDECYKTMMSERTTLITARRESEDNLIKAIIQLSSALVVLMAGFISNAKIPLSTLSFALFCVSILALGFSIIGGLGEQFFSSKAYQEQQILLEQFYTKEISSFSEAPSNRKVRVSQVSAFVFFVLALFSLSAFAVVQGKGKIDVSQQSPSTTPAAAATPSSASTPSSATASTPSEADRRRRASKCYEVSGPIDASAATQERVTREGATACAH